MTKQFLYFTSTETCLVTEGGITQVIHLRDLHPKLVHQLIGLAVVQDQLTMHLRGRRHDNTKSLTLRPAGAMIYLGGTTEQAIYVFWATRQVSPINYKSDNIHWGI